MRAAAVVLLLVLIGTCCSSGADAARAKAPMMWRSGEERAEPAPLTAAVAAFLDRALHGGWGPPGGGGGGGGDCYAVKGADKCADAKGCVWCRNKWSRSKGNDGVCVAEAKSGELPSWGYDCGGGGDDPSRGGGWGPPSGGGGGDGPSPWWPGGGR